LRSKSWRPERDPVGSESKGLIIDFSPDGEDRSILVLKKYSMHISPEHCEELMRQALAEAQAASKIGEVPVGAVIARLDNNKLVICAAAHNLVESHKDPTAHAERLAIQEAAKSLGNWRLSECILCVTLEPCTMCAGAISLARVGCVIFGAADPVQGAYGSLYDLSSDARLPSNPRVIGGVLEKECSTILGEFFARKRK